jgi:hypothetical protein
MKLPQYRIKWIGIFFESLYTALPLLSILNAVSTLIILYVQIQPYLLAHFPWIKLWMFLALIATIVLIGVALTWVILVPSLWLVRHQQLFDKKEETK